MFCSILFYPVPQALPAVEAASQALANLDKNDLTELKAFTNPPPAVKSLCMQLVCLRPTGEKLEENWNDAKKLLSNGSLLQNLKVMDSSILSLRFKPSYLKGLLASDYWLTDITMP